MSEHNEIMDLCDIWRAEAARRKVADLTDRNFWDPTLSHDIGILCLAYGERWYETDGFRKWCEMMERVVRCNKPLADYFVKEQSNG